MVNAERGEGSSSQNDNHTVATIKSAGGVAGDRFRITFTDGSSFFCTYQFIRELGIIPGAELSPDDYAAVRAEHQRLSALLKAMDLLARSEQSSGMLRTKLLQRGFGREAAEEALSVLSEKGYLNDERFAREYVFLRLKRKPEGRMKLAARLEGKGVSREIVQSVLSDFSEEEEIEAIERAGEKILKRSNITKEKAFRALNAKGFSSILIRNFLKDKFF